MAIKTNKSDVIANFVRYYGRQPLDSDMATIDYLTTKVPTEVESLLAKNSPITKGLVWNEYQKQKNSVANQTPVAIPNPSVIKDYNVTGRSADGKTLMGIPKVATTIAPVETQESVDNKYKEAAANNPAIATLAKGGSSLDEIINGLSTGNISGLMDWEGKPFSVEDQQAALAQGMEDNRLYYEAMQSKDKADAEAALAQKQANYQDYLIQSGENFKSDKTTADQTAANNGVLFSGSRVQKEKSMADAYNRDQSTNQRNFTNDIGNTARGFQYKYGNNAASGLNQYYNLGSNTYNPSTAQGGVSSNPLSSVYNPSTYNYQGTANTERATNANTRAAGYLWNKGNKLVATGSNNQY
jgi:hypothetical protein